MPNLTISIVGEELEHEPLSVLEWLARKFAYPVDGPIARAIWRRVNDPRMEEDTARRWMYGMGYKPFVGYPLERIKL